MKFIVLIRIKHFLQILRFQNKIYGFKRSKRKRIGKACNDEQIWGETFRKSEEMFFLFSIVSG